MDAEQIKSFPIGLFSKENESPRAAAGLGEMCACVCVRQSTRGDARELFKVHNSFPNVYYRPRHLTFSTSINFID